MVIPSAEPRAPEEGLTGCFRFLCMETQMVHIFDVSCLDPFISRWKADLLNNYPSVVIHPYADMYLSICYRSICLVADNVEEIDEQVRERVIRHCSDYGRERAEEVVPSLSDLRRAWMAEAENDGFPIPIRKCL